MPILSGPPVTVTREEYALLGGILGATTLIGLPDPFPGMLAEEIRQRLAAVRSGLQQRDLVRVRPDNRVLVQPRLAALMSICAFPEVTCLLTLNRPAQAPEQYIFQVTRQGAVEIRRDQTLHLRPLTDVAERLQELMAFPEAPEIDLPSGTVALSTLQQAAAEDGAGAFLAQSGLAAPLAAAVADTLAHPILNASLVCLHQAGRAWKSDGFGVLAGRNGIWRLGGAGQETVVISSSSREAVRREIAGLLEAHLPAAQVAW